MDPPLFHPAPPSFSTKSSGCNFSRTCLQQLATPPVFPLSRSRCSSFRISGTASLPTVDDSCDKPWLCRCCKVDDPLVSTLSTPLLSPGLPLAKPNYSPITDLRTVFLWHLGCSPCDCLPVWLYSPCDSLFLLRLLRGSAIFFYVGISTLLLVADAPRRSWLVPRRLSVGLTEFLPAAPPIPLEVVKGFKIPPPSVFVIQYFLFVFVPFLDLCPPFAVFASSMVLFCRSFTYGGMKVP